MSWTLLGCVLSTECCVYYAIQSKFIRDCARQTQRCVVCALFDVEFFFFILSFFTFPFLSWLIWSLIGEIWNVKPQTSFGWFIHVFNGEVGSTYTIKLKQNIAKETEREKLHTTENEKNKIGLGVGLSLCVRLIVNYQNSTFLRSNVKRID